MIRHIFGAILLCLLPILSACADTTSAKIDAPTKIAAMVQKIKAESSVDIRRQTSADMWDFVWKLDDATIAAIDTGMIDKITGLLSDNDDSIRYYVAGTLARFGPRAKNAVPALEAALKRVPPYPVDLGSDSAILGALHRITGKPQEPTGPNISQIVDDYVRQTRGWPKDAYRIESIVCQPDICDYTIHYNDDETNTVPGGGKSFDIEVDEKNLRVVRELGFQ